MSCQGDSPPPQWWHDAALLQAEYQAHGTLEAVRIAHGAPSARTLREWWGRLHLPQLPHGPQSTPVLAGENPGDEWLLAALKKTGYNATVTELANLADVSPQRVQDALERLGDQGYRIREEEQRVTLNRVPVPSNLEHRVLFDGEVYRFGIVSDVHLGSKHCRLEELHMAYAMLKDEDISTVYNPGDIVCGLGIFRTQSSEIDLHTFEDQVTYAAEHYPKVDGITTHLIGGNHDLEGEYAKAGANAALAVANRRDDIDYGGDYSATYELPQGTRILLRHPKGGKGYAKSYKPQKFAESFEGGSKPNVCLLGHYHDAGHWIDRNIQMLMCGTFEGGGTLGIRVPLGAPAVGFWIVEMKVADDGSIVRFKPEWFHYFAGRKVE